MTSQPNTELPRRIYAEAVVHATSGESLLRTSQLITSDNVSLFYSPVNDLNAAAERFRLAGFEVLDIGKTSVNIAASSNVFERSFNANLAAIERPVIKGFGQQTTATFIDSVDAAPFGEIDIKDTVWADLLDGVSINEPAYYLQRLIPSATPPPTNARYLQVPSDLAEALSATLAHEAGITGKGVNVVAVDSGCYVDHPFFKRHRYDLNVVLGPGATNPDEDPNGHGTGIAANVFAIAPEVTLTVLKADIALQNKIRHVNSTAAFRRAVSLRPDIITCSWGSDLRSPYQLSSSHKILSAEIAEAIRQGIVVIFAAGNGQWGFPSQHPDVVAVGGVYKHLEGPLKGRLEASNYASSFISAIYPNRRVPDICGLVGQLPNAAYIMLPVPPGSDTDKSRSILGDQTEDTDGWAAFSGTSSAAPQLAGACALLEQFVPKLGPLKIKQILQETASDILEGGSNPSSGGGQARDGPDLATGYGLAVAYEAMQAAKKAALDPKDVRLMESTEVYVNKTILEQKDILEMKTANQNLSLTHTKSSSIIGERKIMNSDFPHLEARLEELLWEFQKIIQEKFRVEGQQKIEDVQLALELSNFTKSLFSEKIVFSLRKSLDECFSSCGIDVNLIKEEHITIAQGLVKFGRHEKAATGVLAEALSSGNSRVRKAALNAISECGDEIHTLNNPSKEDAALLFDGPFCDSNNREFYRYGDKEHYTGRDCKK